jgi:hypothetical protein
MEDRTKGNEIRKEKALKVRKENNTKRENMEAKNEGGKKGSKHSKVRAKVMNK